MVLDERGGHPPGPEIRIVEHRLEERDVRRHTTDPELRDRPSGTVHRGGEVAATTRELGEHGVEVTAHLGAGVRRAAVEAYPRPAGRAVRRDPAGVWPEAVGRVLRGDPALERGPTQGDRLLAQPEVRERLPGGDAHLGLDEINVGDLLGNRVLDLDPRV